MTPIENVADRVTDIWVYLSASPLLWLTLTLGTYLAATNLYERAGRIALLNPVMISVILIGSVLIATGTDYGDYFAGAQFIHFLLGPATVSLAVPLYRQFERVRENVLALAASLLCGSAVAVASALGAALLFHLDAATLGSLAPKSVTAPVAMGIAEQIGGLPSLTAVFVILTGILGAAAGPGLLSLCGITDPAARGFALGTASHGIGTARALEEGEIAGAFAGLAMGLNALATAVLLPLIWRMVF